MAEGLQNQLALMLQQLSDALGVAVPKLWEWALLQVKVSIIQSVFSIILAVILVVVTYKLYVYVIKKWDDFYRDDKEVPIVVGMAILTAVTTIITGIAICDIYMLPQYIINPEFSAFQNIVRELAKLK